ncbi:sensor histidine kinase [Streptomyces sp. NBC_01276]|uniref:sensor histidine kinase n=1 Tax=Streptomyces sp. NBC_01276 TaxID=2903808 RepID=UPI00352FD430
MHGRTPTTVARAVAWLILLTATVFLLEAMALWLAHRPPPGQVVAAVLGSVAFGFGYARTVWDAVARGRGRNRHQADLAVCASVSFAMLLALGPAWGALPCLAAGAAVVSLTPRRWGWVVPLILAGTALAGLMLAVPADVLVDMLVKSAVTVMVLGTLGVLPPFAREMHDNRAELARLAVVEERLRFSRDLHDVLGHGLSVIGMKMEVALLLIGNDPDKAAGEIRDALGISRESASDLRTLVRGYRQQSIAAELDGVRSVLSSAGIGCRADEVPPDIPQHVQDVTGWIVREGVTNILRHSKATECRIKLRVNDGRLMIEISNDNPIAPGSEGRTGGSGLRGLRERLAVVGGELTTGVHNGTFTLLAHAPLGEGKRHDSGAEVIHR